jgi:hypothetical protein
MLEQVEKKNSKSSPRALLLGAAVLVVAGIVYLFWPNVKGFRQTAKAALASNADVSLTAILYAEDNPLAMVDGKIVREGDMIGGVKVVKILKNGVEFETSDTRCSGAAAAWLAQVSAMQTHDADIGQAKG